MPDTFDRLKAALADRYAIERELGAGGMATVYLAEDLKHHRKVAVKVLRPELAAVLGAERFLREIEIAANLTHPHILPLHDSGEADGFLYYVMPYIEGESLRQRLARSGELPIAEAVHILREVVDALAKAHGHGVVHRDIKPDNVMLADRHALVTDFGVAKAVSEATGRQQLTTAGVALGTPAYMAPEQAVADPHIDHRADIYAVGAVAYELLTGRPPFTGTTPQMVLSAHVTEAPEPVTKDRQTVPPALARLVMKCLEKKPADRWQSAEELLPQLEALATPSGGITPTATTPVSAVHAPRQKTLVGAGALLGVLVLAAFGWWLLAGRGGAVDDQTSGRIPIAVLVFENRSAAEDEEYFSEGIADDINTQLSKIGGFAVKAHASARRLSREEMSYGEIADELGAEYLVHGNWRRAGDSVRITARLIVPETEDQLWADSYNRELTASNLFGVRSDVAEQVATALNVAVAPSAQAQLGTPPTASMEALSAYQLGRFFWNQRTEEGIRRAIDHFTAAIAADADYALAYAGLEEAYVMLPYYSSADPVEAFTAARDAAEKALAIDGTLGEAYVSLGLISHVYEWDLEGAEDAYRKAISLNPNYATAHQWYGSLLIWVGRVDEAEREFRRAQELDPLSIVINWHLGLFLQIAGRYDEAIEHYRKSLELDPNSDRLRAGLGYAYLDNGMIDEARAEFERLNEDLRSVRAYVLLGDHQRALRVYGESREAANRMRVSKVQLADAAWALADTSEAFEWLAGAVEDRDPDVIGFSTEPWRSLRGDARFRRILNSMGLDAEGDRIVPLEKRRER